MKAVPTCLMSRSGVYYCRRRIPKLVRPAYPSSQREIVVSLKTRDRREAEKRLRFEMLRLDAEFESKAAAAKHCQALTTVERVRTLVPEQIQALAQYWIRNVLATDERQRAAGLDEAEFEANGRKLTEQREELGRLLARGQVAPILPAMRSFLYLCGMDIELAPAQAQEAGYTFLQAVVTALDHQCERQAGRVVPTDAVAPDVPHPKLAVAQADPGPSWDAVFDCWSRYVANRPKPTVIAHSTPWHALRVFAMKLGVTAPAALTPDHLNGFVATMDAAGLAVKTINSRLTQLRSIFKIAVGRGLLQANPAANTLGFKETARDRAVKRRLPFSDADLATIFGSPVFVDGKRSFGQAGEASYWIPLIMFYTGARTEEVAGLQIADVVQDLALGWYFNITDQVSDADRDRFDDGHVPGKRRLKNVMSRRKVPVAQELIDLGFLDYLAWLREQGASALFPTLRPDFHGKLAGAFGKWAGRYLRSLGIAEKKVLYSFRHTFKDLLERAQIPSKYLKRLIGHASGDGAITDSYGSGDVPFEHVCAWFARIAFPPILARRWSPPEVSGAGIAPMEDR